MSNQNDSQAPTTSPLCDDNIAINGTSNLSVATPLLASDLLRKIFENETGDWEMVASDGKVFKFHQFVLGEQIEYFRALFSHHDTMEVKTKRIIVPPEVDVSGSALEAFLRYFYYKHTAGMTKSFSVTCALIRAGHYYNIPKLVNVSTAKIKQFAKETDNMVWFNVEELWDLYQHVWLWEDTHPSKSTLMEVIVDVLKIFCNGEEDQRKLLALTNGNEVLRDLILAFAKTSSPSPPVASRIANERYRDIVSREYRRRRQNRLENRLGGSELGFPYILHNNVM